MSRSVASLVLVRGGKREIFEEVWGTPYRDLLWGPSEFEAWVTNRDAAEYEPEELSALVIADYDRRVLEWFESEAPTIPAIKSLYSRLLTTAWPGFTLRELTEQQAYVEKGRIWAEVDTDAEPGDDDEGAESERSLVEQDNPLEWRPGTVEDASLYYEEVEVDEEEEAVTGLDEDDYGNVAWVSIIDGAGEPRHRILSELSQDILAANPQAVPMLAKQRPASIPAEDSTVEGLCIDVPQKKIHIWGNLGTRELFPHVQAAWKDWEVNWLDANYREHCQLVGTPGKLMSDAKGLASFVPFVLRTEKMDMAQMVGEMGGAIKKTAMKAVGCLTIVLAFPILLTGLFMSKLKESLYAIATLVVVVAVLFKIAEWRFRAKFRNSAIGRMTESEPDERPPVAGPLDKEKRRQAIDALLASAGLPVWKDIQPHAEMD